MLLDDCQVKQQQANRRSEKCRDLFRWKDFPYSYAEYPGMPYTHVFEGPTSTGMASDCGSMQAADAVICFHKNGENKIDISTEIVYHY